MKNQPDKSKKLGANKFCVEKHGMLKKYLGKNNLCKKFWGEKNCVN